MDMDDWDHYDHYVDGQTQANELFYRNEMRRENMRKFKPSTLSAKIKKGEKLTSAEKLESTFWVDSYGKVRDPYEDMDADYIRNTMVFIYRNRDRWMMDDDIQIMKDFAYDTESYFHTRIVTSPLWKTFVSALEQHERDLQELKKPAAQPEPAPLAATEKQVVRLNEIMLQIGRINFARWVRDRFGDTTIVGLNREQVQEAIMTLQCYLTRDLPNDNPREW